MKQERHILNDLDLEILESLKVQMKIHIEHLLERNVRSTNVQIEVESYLRSLLKQD